VGREEDKNSNLSLAKPQTGQNQPPSLSQLAENNILAKEAF
jgi:hypothetical protein